MMSLNSILIIIIKNKLRKITLYFARHDSLVTVFLLLMYRQLKKSFGAHQFLPMEWMDKSVACKKGLLCRETEGKVFTPHFVNGSQTIHRILLPEIHYRIFENATISLKSSSVILSGNKVLVERVNGINANKVSYATGHILEHGETRALVRLGDIKKIKKGIFLGGNGSSNYYHWVVEILPKLQYLSQLPEKFGKFPILVSDDAENIPTFREMLSLLVKDVEVIVLNKNEQYSVATLVYIDSPSKYPFILREEEKLGAAYSRIREESLYYLRHTIFENMKLSANEKAIYPKRVFLCRKNIRRIYNQDEVYRFLEKFEFEKIFMEDLSVEKQVNLMKHAEWIVGPTGAAWSNLIFCQAGVKCLCWMAEEYGEFSLFSTIAGLVGAELRYVAYKANTPSIHELYRKDYSIDIKLVEAGLFALDENIIPCREKRNKNLKLTYLK